uniref:Uncharacterized protein n=1 Tax=Knipowitschia caucasica TaxID=637954 RepID=A0AAV2KEY9_KNICA
MEVPETSIKAFIETWQCVEKEHDAAEMNFHGKLQKWLSNEVDHFGEENVAQELPWSQSEEAWNTDETIFKEQVDRLRSVDVNLRGDQESADLADLQRQFDKRQKHLAIRETQRVQIEAWYQGRARILDAENANPSSPLQGHESEENLEHSHHTVSTKYLHSEIERLRRDNDSLRKKYFEKDQYFDHVFTLETQAWRQEKEQLQNTITNLENDLQNMEEMKQDLCVENADLKSRFISFQTVRDQAHLEWMTKELHYERELDQAADSKIVFLRRLLQMQQQLRERDATIRQRQEELEQEQAMVREKSEEIKQTKAHVQLELERLEVRRLQERGEHENSLYKSFDRQRDLESEMLDLKQTIEHKNMEVAWEQKLLEMIEPAPETKPETHTDTEKRGDRPRWCSHGCQCEPRFPQCTCDSCRVFSSAATPTNYHQTDLSASPQKPEAGTSRDKRSFIMGCLL